MISHRIADYENFLANQAKERHPFRISFKGGDDRYLHLHVFMGIGVEEFNKMDALITAMPGIESHPTTYGSYTFREESNDVSIKAILLVRLINLINGTNHVTWDWEEDSHTRGDIKGTIVL